MVVTKNREEKNHVHVAGISQIDQFTYLDQSGKEKNLKPTHSKGKNSVDLSDK